MYPKDVALSGGLVHGGPGTETYEEDWGVVGPINAKSWEIIV